MGLIRVLVDLAVESELETMKLALKNMVADTSDNLTHPKLEWP